MPTTDLLALAAALVTAKQKLDDAKSVFSVAEASFDEAEQRLAEAMQAAGEEQLQTQGMFLSMKTSHRWSVPADHKDRVVDVFKQHEPALVKETIHPASLTKFANDMLANASPPAWWGEARAMLLEQTSASVSVTKSKPKK